MYHSHNDDDNDDDDGRIRHPHEHEHEHEHKHLTPFRSLIAGGKRARASPQKGRIERGRGNVLLLQDCGGRPNPLRGPGPCILSKMRRTLRFPPALPARATGSPGHPLPGTLSLIKSLLQRQTWERAFPIRLGAEFICLIPVSAGRFR
jgi:hypothetical protein